MGFKARLVYDLPQLNVPFMPKNMQLSQTALAAAEQVFGHMILCGTRHICLNYFSTVVTKHHNKINLEKKNFYWGSRFQVVSPRPLQQEAWQWVSRHGTGVVTKSLHLILKYGAERERRVSGPSIQNLKA